MAKLKLNSRELGAPDKPRGAELMALTQKLLTIGTFDH